MTQFLYNLYGMRFELKFNLIKNLDRQVEYNVWYSQMNYICEIEKTV